MPKGRRVVIKRKAESDRLPDWASEGGVLTESLHQGGVLEQIGKRLRVQREGGYVGLDVLLFFLFFFASGLRIGIKEFGGRTKPHRRQLAALGGRIHLPTPPSVSRFLGAVERQDIDEFGPWLLFEGTGAREVLRHPSTMHRDTEGGGWHFFDWDPTSTVLRQRALPIFDEMPAGRRRTDALRPGYPGRKRGDVQLSRATLQHAGSGLWLGIWMAPGNGEPKMAFDTALQTIRSTCEIAELSTENAVIRSDGQGGNVPYIAACQAANIHYVTRWATYGLLQQTAVREHLNQTTWYEVQDSGSGPRRQAAELGWFTLPASRRTRQPDGSHYDPVKSRLVVSRFRAEKKRGSGLFIDGWQYELFATDLKEQPWPAPELVTTYYGRIGQENRFGQEDRELELDRIFSYHIPGQALANLIGLFVWNLRICRGMDLACPPRERAPQEHRAPVAVDEPVELDLPASTEDQDAAPRLPGEVPTGVEDQPTPTREQASSPQAARATPGEAPREVLPSAPVTAAPLRQPIPSNRVEQTATTSSVDSTSTHQESPHEQVDRPEASHSAANDPAQPLAGKQQSTGQSGAASQPNEPSDRDVDNTPLVNPANDTNDLDKLSPTSGKQQLLAALNELPWPILLQGKPNWSWDPERGLLCPDGLVIPLTSVKRFPLDNWRHLRFKAPYATCPSCDRKSECTKSEAPTYRKEIIFSIPPHVAASIEALLDRSRPALPSKRIWQSNDAKVQLKSSGADRRESCTGESHRARSTCPGEPLKAQNSSPCDLRPTEHSPMRGEESASPDLSAEWTQRPRKPPSHRSSMEAIMPTWEQPDDEDSGESPYSITSPILIPAELRKFFREKCLGIDTYVTVDMPGPVALVRVFALTPGERQHRRLSWEQRHEWNQLPDDATVTIQFADGFGILPLLKTLSSTTRSAAA